jgi:hypothetical protein
MVAASPLPPQTPDTGHRARHAAVELRDGALVVADLVETDPEVVRVVREAALAGDDPDHAVVDATRQCLRVGARAVLAANVSVETHIVEKRFDAMSERFDEQVEAAVTRISQVTTDLLDEEVGALPQALEAHRSELDRLLGDTFDPDSRRSVIALFEEVIVGAHTEQARGIAQLLATDGEESPLARLRRELVRDMGERLHEVRRDVVELSEKIAVTEAVAPVLELTTGKGFRFEDVVDACVSRIAAQHGDVAERVGTETGVSGSQKGDELVTLNADDTNGYEARFALEAKTRKLTMRNTLAELDDAIENRDAYAAIAVFSTQEKAPTSVPFHYAGNKAIVVLDDEGLDDSALRLAYMWARWVVRRDLCGGSADEVDFERVTTLIDDASRAIDRCTQIRKYHTQARNGIDKAGAELDAMVDGVRESLDAIAEEIAASEDADGSDGES